MTPHFVGKNEQGTRNDRYVIVDNSVEIGDFFAFSPIFAKYPLADFLLKIAGGEFQKQKNTNLVNKKPRYIDRMSIRAFMCFGRKFIKEKE